MDVAAVRACLPAGGLALPQEGTAENPALIERRYSGRHWTMFVPRGCNLRARLRLKISALATPTPQPAIEGITTGVLANRRDSDHQPRRGAVASNGVRLRSQ